MLQRDVPSIDLYRLDWCMLPQISQIYSVIHPGKRHNICERCMISEPKKKCLLLQIYIRDCVVRSDAAKCGQYLGVESGTRGVIMLTIPKTLLFENVLP